MRKSIAVTLTIVLGCSMITACGGAKETPASSGAQTESVANVTQGGTADNEEFIPETTTDNQKAVLSEVTEAIAKVDRTFNVENVNERNLVFWDRMGEEHIMGQTELAFYYSLAILSDGKITADMMVNGEIDVDSTNLPEAYTVFDVSRYQLEIAGQNGYAKGAVFGLPYVFENRDNFWKFAESSLGQEVIDEINKGGFACHVLAYIEEGARNYFTTKAHPISTYKDLAGLKLRVQSTDIYNGMVQAIGASPTTMAWSEVYTGLSSGVVDGAENPYTGYNAAMLFEVAPYIYEDEHIWGANILSISSDIWDSLNDDEKALFEEAAKIASEYNKKHAAEVELKIKDKLVENGVMIVTPNAQEKAELAELCKPLYEKYAGEYLDFIDQIKAQK